jgi:nucleoside-diphosphate-sugar epimerase
LAKVEVGNDDWRDVSVLVTGARGFIARRLCARLTQSGAIVHGTSRRPPHSLLAPIHWWATDLGDVDVVRGLLREIRPRTVFHLAGHVSGSQRLSEVHPAFAANVLSTVNLLAAAAGSDSPQIVLTGSMQEPADPAGAPCSPYAASKVASTAYARMFHALYDLPLAVARPMMVYGPEQWDASKLLPYVITALMRGDRPRLTSGARQLDWVFVDDVVEGLLRIAASPGANGREIELGSGKLTSVRQIAEKAAALLGTGVTPLYGAVPDRRLEVPRAARTADTLALTGWSATTSLEDGLRQTIEWHRSTVIA